MDIGHYDDSASAYFYGSHPVRRETSLKRLCTYSILTVLCTRILILYIVYLHVICYTFYIEENLLTTFLEDSLSLNSILTLNLKTTKFCIGNKEAKRKRIQFSKIHSSHFISIFSHIKSIHISHT